jgi:hypothetical protein
VFRRKQSEPEPVETPTKVGGKGRPTPTRKEAEAAAKEKARAPRTRKERAQRQRSVKTESSAKIRAGMKAGDERYLLARDKGPVKRFIRDFVDSRFSIVELLIPLLLVTLVLGYTGVPNLVALSSTMMMAVLAITVVDALILRRRLRKELAVRFPDAPLKGTTYYAVTRSMQMKFMRLPKPQVKVGQDLSQNRYR